KLVAQDRLDVLGQGRRQYLLLLPVEAVFVLGEEVVQLTGRDVDVYWFSENRKFAFAVLALFRDSEVLRSWRCVSGLAVQGGLAGGVAFGFPPFTGFFQLAVASGKDLLLTAVELILGGEVADRAVQPDSIIVLDEAGDDPLGVPQGEGRPRADAVL